jgi:hypothetical protein
MYAETLVCRMYWQNPKYPPPPISRIPTKKPTFGFLDMFNEDNKLVDAYRLQQRIVQEMMRQQVARKNEAIVEREAERQRIFEKHLLASQGRSNVLKDFFTNLF